MWSSKTILVSYFGVFLMSIILLSILKIKNNLKNLLSYTLIFIIFIPLVVTNFSYFGFKRDYLGSLQYPYSSEIPRMADSYELICLLNDKINCERPNGENYFIILEIDNNLLDMNNNTLIIDYNFIGRELEFGINKNYPPKFNNNKFDQHSDYKLLFNIKEFSINNINCNYKNKDGFCSILSKDNNNYNLNLKYIKEIYNTQKIYLTLNLSEFLIRGININDINNNNLLRIIPKVNKYFKNCSIDRFINPQKFINLNCNNDINEKTKIIYSNEGKNYFNIKLNNSFELINNLDYTINITGIFYRLKNLFIKDFQKNIVDNNNIDNNSDKNLIKNKTKLERLLNYHILFGSNSFLNHEINNFKSLSHKSHDFYNYKKQISTESDIPILNFLGENGIITTLLCFIFFSVSLYLTIINLFKSKDIFIKFISFFSFCSLTAICIGMFHLNLLFKIEIGYLIFTIIGINANLYLKNYNKRLYE